MSNITYQVESFDQVYAEILPLLVEHWKEVAMYKDKIKLKIDYKRYKQLDEAGVMHIVTMRDGCVLTGYFVSFIQPHLHYCDNVYALNDILYIKPEYRKAGLAFAMFKYAEDRLKELGVDVIILHMKTQFPFHSLAQGLGYEKAEWNYSKYIGD